MHLDSRMIRCLYQKTRQNNYVGSRHQDSLLGNVNKLFSHAQTAGLMFFQLVNFSSYVVHQQKVNCHPAVSCLVKLIGQGGHIGTTPASKTQHAGVISRALSILFPFLTFCTSVFYSYHQSCPRLLYPAVSQSRSLLRAGIMFQRQRCSYDSRPVC